jgi:DNA-binding transcriptional LysR family regulator
LRDFLAVVETGSFRAAAERLNAQQSAISRNILEFEASVGAKIFNRHPTGARLTPLGAQLAPDIIAIIVAVDGLSAKAASISKSKDDQFALGLDTDLPIAAIQQFMVAISAHIEEAQITLVQRNAFEIISSVRERQVQLGVIRERQLPSDVSFRRFLVGELLAAVPDDGQVDSETIDPRVLLDQHVHIARDDISGEAIGRLRDILGTDVNLTVHDCNPAGLIGLVASGLGIGLMTVAPDEAAKLGVKVLRVEPNIPAIGITALWSTDAPPVNLTSLIDQLESSNPSSLARSVSRRPSKARIPGDAGSN